MLNFPININYLSRTTVQSAPWIRWIISVSRSTHQNFWMTCIQDRKLIGYILLKDILYDLYWKIQIICGRFSKSGYSIVILRCKLSQHHKIKSRISIKIFHVPREATWKWKETAIDYCYKEFYANSREFITLSHIYVWLLYTHYYPE